MIKVDYSKSGISLDEIMSYSDKVKKIHKKLNDNKNDESKMLGWMEYPSTIDKKLVEKIDKIGAKIREESEILVVIGIGRSYLGARAVIEALSPSFKTDDSLEVIFARCNLSSNYLSELIDYISDKDFSINVISKSGTTTEPAIAFRVLRDVLENKYGIDEARDRIYVTTDSSKGALVEMAKQEGYESFVIPDNIGGRFSVLTPVGLLPIAAKGLNIYELLEGAKFAQDKFDDEEVKYNICYQYSVIRNILYKKQKDIEIFECYEPKMTMIGEWLKQLFGESEGKDKKGIFPASVINTTDLHSMGQFIQDGSRIMFETVINVENVENDINIIEDEDNLDKLNYLAGKTLSYVNQKAQEGTIIAHVKGGVPNIRITIEKLDEKNIGELIYFFEKAVATSASLLEVNPFDQPGVEEYKNTMFRLLEKPRYVEKGEN